MCTYIQREEAHVPKLNMFDFLDLYFIPEQYIYNDNSMKVRHSTQFFIGNM
jgi:hypothetical protein